MWHQQHWRHWGLTFGACPQIVKVHVLGIDPALRRMQLSLASQKARAAAAAAQAGGPQPGEVADGIVAGIEASEDGAPAAYRVDLRRGQEVVGTGRLEAAHVADHPAAVEALQDSIQVRACKRDIALTPPLQPVLYLNSLARLVCRSSLGTPRRPVPKSAGGAGAVTRLLGAGRLCAGQHPGPGTSSEASTAAADAQGVPRGGCGHPPTDD